MNQKANFKTVTLKDLWGVFVQRLWATRGLHLLWRFFGV